MTTHRTYPIARRFATLVALGALVTTIATTALGASAVAAPATAAPPARAAKIAPSPATRPDEDAPARAGKKAPTGKLNLNTASEDQLVLLPGVGPAKAERVVAWRKKNGNFKRVADLRKVKGFGYKTLKKLEPWLDVRGESTLAATAP